MFIGIFFAIVTIGILYTGHAKAGRGGNAPVVTREGNPKAFWSQVALGGMGTAFGIGNGIRLICWAED